MAAAVISECVNLDFYTNHTISFSFNFRALMMDLYFFIVVDEVLYLSEMVMINYSQNGSMKTY